MTVRQPRALRSQRAQQMRPIGWYGLFTDCTCPIRIIEIQDRGLAEWIGGTEAGGMIGIALHLDWASSAMGDQHAIGIACHYICRCKCVAASHDIGTRP